MTKTIFHMTTPSDWQQAQASGVYSAPSLHTEGFIHASALNQVLKVANAIYTDEPQMILLEIDVARLSAEVKWEAPAHPAGSPPPATTSNETFPHIYGTIPVNAVIAVHDLPREGDQFVLPPALVSR